MNRHTLQRLGAFAFAACALGLPFSAPAQTAPAPAANSANTFTNPLLDVGPDPWVISYKGFYYYMNSMGRNVTIWKTADMTDLRHAEKKVVFQPEPGHPWSRATAPGSKVGAGYFTVANQGSTPDRLVSVSSAFSEKAEMHETTTENGVSRMRPIAGGTVNQTIAATICAAGTVRSRIRRPTGTIIAPPMPCSSR